MPDAVGVVYADERFAALFATRGRPAEAPWRVALVTVMQLAGGRQRQARATQRFAVAHCAMDRHAERATCPAARAWAGRR